MERTGLRGFRTRVRCDFSSLAGALALALLVTACGDDGPTQPEPSSLSDLFGTQLFAADGTTVGLAGLNQAELIGIYFASPGCPACGAFTPLLVDAYSDMIDAGRPFEVVLVTNGISLSVMYDYMADEGMEWLAVSPLSPKANALANRYDVRWVPTLIIIEPDGTIVSMSGREQVTGQGADAWNIWMSSGSGG